MPKDRKSLRDKALRAGLVAACLALGWASITAATGMAASSRDPGLAYRVNPDSGLIQAALASSSFSANPTFDRDAESARMARAALQTEPTAVNALTVVGYQAQLRGDLAAAARIFAQVERLSRRALQAQIWAIEEAVKAGDVGLALHHYDIALTTSRGAADALLPVLAQAMSRPLIRQRLIELMLEGRPWSDSVFNWLGGRPSDPQSYGAFIKEAQSRGLRVPADAKNGVALSLIARGDGDAAWSLMGDREIWSAGQIPRNPDFAPQAAGPSPFLWSVIDMDGGYASISTEQEARGLSFGANSAATMAVATQYLLLTPGRYRLDGTSTIDSTISDNSVAWTVKCNDGKLLMKVPIRGAENAVAKFNGQFSVPQTCSTQILSLDVSPSESERSGRVTRISVLPL